MAQEAVTSGVWKVSDARWEVVNEEVYRPDVVDEERKRGTPSVLMERARCLGYEKNLPFKV